jgi:hypothetical protein
VLRTLRRSTWRSCIRKYAKHLDLLDDNFRHLHLALWTWAQHEATSKTILLTLWFYNVICSPSRHDGNGSQGIQWKGVLGNEVNLLNFAGGLAGLVERLALYGK